MSKPKNTEEMNVDIYFEQFSEPGDDPTITVHNSNDCYEFHHSAGYKEIKEEAKRMRKDAAWLLKAADYIEKKLIKKNSAQKKQNGKTNV